MVFLVVHFFRMDSSIACRIAVRATTNLKPRTTDFQLVVDRDTTNLKDLTDDVATKFGCGANQGLNLPFYNKQSKCYSTLTPDSMLMDAIDMYWDLRRLVVYVGVYDTVAVAYSQSVSADEAVPALEPPVQAGDHDVAVPALEPPVQASDHDVAEPEPDDDGDDGGSDTDGEVGNDSDGEGSDTDGEVDNNDVVDDDESWEEDE